MKKVQNELNSKALINNFANNKKYLVFLIFIQLISLNTSLFSQPPKNINLSMNVVEMQEWDAYIGKYSPSDSAYTALQNIVNTCRFINRNSYAWFLLQKYFPLYQEKKDWFESQNNIVYHYMLLESPMDSLAYSCFEEFVNKNAPREDAFVAVQRIAENHINYQRWDSAAIIIKKYRDKFPQKRVFIDTLLSILSKDKENIFIRNLGDSINTSSDEWDPNPTNNGQYMFFTANGRAGGYGQSDVWYSENIDGVWQKAKNVGTAINGKNNETIDNVSSDGNFLLLSGDFVGTFGKFDIYYIERTRDGWGSLMHFPAPINSKFVDEGGNLSSDGKALLFTSDRPGGVPPFVEYGSIYHGSTDGNMDIWVSLKDDEGNWGEPINLGKTINTPFAERSPFLHPDGKTLYFSSNGHPNLGALDVFVSHRLKEDSWTEWSPPVNLGKEINTIRDDWGYKIGLTGDSAVFSARNRTIGYGALDIYSITLPNSVRPDLVFTIQGKVTDKKGKALAAKIVWEDLESGKILGEAKSNPSNGNYFIVLPLGKNYGYYAEKENYFTSSNNVDLRKVKAFEQIQVNIELSALSDIKKDSSIVINNIFFDYNSSILKKESLPELKRLLSFLKKGLAKKIEIAGHTDNIGGSKFNKKLSLERAESIKKYLVENGIDAKLLIAKGYGDTKAIATNETENGRAKNRRVEIKILE